MTAFKEEENLTSSKKVKMGFGEGPGPKRRKWRMYDERLSSIADDFDECDPMDLGLPALYCKDAVHELN